MKIVRKSKRKWLYVAVAVALLAIGAVVALELTNTTYLFHKSPPPPPATGPNTKGEVSSNTDNPQAKSSDGTSSPANPTQKTDGTSNPTAALLAPSGVFVSNHRPNLSGHPAPNTVTSTCSTTPGASCQITFTMGGTTKSLPAKTTDSQGSAYWDWSLQSIGLTQGTWSVKAISTSNGESKTTADPQEMVVAS